MREWVDSRRLTSEGSSTQPGPMASKAKPAKKAVPKKKTAKESPKRVKAPKPPKQAKRATLDLSALPPESLMTQTRGLCLACALDVLTRHMGLSAERAQSEIRRHRPELEE